MRYDIDVEKEVSMMDKLLKYRKQMIVLAILVIVLIVSSGIYILNTTMNNINCSRSEAHTIALNRFPGTIISSEVEYEDLEIVYEIIIEDQNQEQIEVDISAKTSRIIGFEYKE